MLKFDNKELTSFDEISESLSLIFKAATRFFMMFQKLLVFNDSSAIPF